MQLWTQMPSSLAHTEDAAHDETLLNWHCVVQDAWREFQAHIDDPLQRVEELSTAQLSTQARWTGSHWQSASLMHETLLECLTWQRVWH